MLHAGAAGAARAARHRRCGRHRRRRPRQPPVPGAARAPRPQLRGRRPSRVGTGLGLAVVSASGARSRANRLLRAVERHLPARRGGGFTADELDRARKKLRYRYAVLADSRLDQAVALAESALWGFPDPGRRPSASWRGPVARRDRGRLAPGRARARRDRASAVMRWLTRSADRSGSSAAGSRRSAPA